jgi:gas vesicle protein
MADALGFVGLERRRSRMWERIALVGAGAAVGAGTALLLAPASGKETRKRIKERAVELAEEAEQMGERALSSAENAISEGLSQGNNSRDPSTSQATHSH